MHLKIWDKRKKQKYNNFEQHILNNCSYYSGAIMKEANKYLKYIHQESQLQCTDLRGPRGRSRQVHHSEDTRL